LDENLDPLERDVEASLASTPGSTRRSSAALQVVAASSDDAHTNEEFLSLHSGLEQKERKANKSVYGTPEYRQAVDRARQRQKEREKVLDRLRPSPKASPQASPDANAQEAPKSGTVSKAEAKKIARQASADKKKEEAAAARFAPQSLLLHGLSVFCVWFARQGAQGAWGAERKAGQGNGRVRPRATSPARRRPCPRVRPRLWRTCRSSAGNSSTTRPP
jgi:hypothetical protein